MLAGILQDGRRVFFGREESDFEAQAQYHLAKSPMFVLDAWSQLLPMIHFSNSPVERSRPMRARSSSKVVSCNAM